MTAHQHQTQLGCYALLYRASTGQRETGFELHHLIKTKQPKIEVVTLDPMSPALERELHALIRDYLGGIDDQRWIPSPGQHCGWCAITSTAAAASPSADTEWPPHKRRPVPPMRRVRPFSFSPQA